MARLLTSRLDWLTAEGREVLRAGLAAARWVTMDDTAARHVRQDGVTTQIGDDCFTACRTGASKSRQAFLDAPRRARRVRDQRAMLRWVVPDGSVTALDLLRSLARPAQDADQKVVPILDHLPVHRSAKVRV